MPPHASTTRRYLTCGGLAAVQAVIILASTPLTIAAANLAPPVYALLSVLSVLLIHLAPRVVGLGSAATLTAALTALVIVPFSAIGFLAAVPLIVQGGVIDLTLRVTKRRRAAHFALAGVFASTAAFLVSLPVFSADHLVPVILVATLGARIVAGVTASLVAGWIARALRAAGVGEVSRRRG